MVGIWARPSNPRKGATVKKKVAVVSVVDAEEMGKEERSG
jgi:hypothetical protein